MSKDEVNNLSRKIIKQIKTHFNLDKFQVLGFYMPLGNEVDLRSLMDELLNKGKLSLFLKC